VDEEEWLITLDTTPLGKPELLAVSVESITDLSAS
jgi:hypothetical protein